MKQIKLSGRERAVLRYLDWATGTLGEELAEATRMEPEDLVDVLNALLEAGYVELVPYAAQTDVTHYAKQKFEVNPGYALELKSAMRAY